MSSDSELSETNSDKTTSSVTADPSDPTISDTFDTPSPDEPEPELEPESDSLPEESPSLSLPQPSQPPSLFPLLPPELLGLIFDFLLVTPQLSKTLLSLRLTCQSLNLCLTDPLRTDLYPFCQFVFFQTLCFWDDVTAAGGGGDDDGGAGEIPNGVISMGGIVRHLIVVFCGRKGRGGRGTSGRGGRKKRERRSERTSVGVGEREGEGEGSQSRGQEGEVGRRRGRKGKRGRRRRRGRRGSPGRRRQERDFSTRKTKTSHLLSGESENFTPPQNAFLRKILPSFPRLVSLSIRFRGINAPISQFELSAEDVLLSDELVDRCVFASVRSLRLRNCCLYLSREMTPSLLLPRLLKACPRLELLDLAGVREHAGKKKKLAPSFCLIPIGLANGSSEWNLKKLDVSGHSIKWTGFVTLLRSFPQLEMMVVVECGIEYRPDSEMIFRDESRLSTLISLAISQNVVGLHGLILILRLCPSLQELDFSKNRVDTRRTSSLASLWPPPFRAEIAQKLRSHQALLVRERMQTLNASGNELFCYSDFLRYVQFPGIQQFRADSCPLNELCFRRILELGQNLRSLDLRDNAIASVDFPGRFDYLNHFVLRSSSRVNRLAVALSEVMFAFPNLLYLDLSNCDFSLGHLHGPHPSLRNLIVQGVTIQGGELNDLFRPFPNLSFVDFTFVQFADQSLRWGSVRDLEDATAFQQNESVTQLILTNSYTGTRAFVSLLNFFVGLKRIECCHGRVGEQDGQWFRRLNSHESLVEIDLGHNPIHSEEVRSLVEKTPNLRVLKIAGVEAGIPAAHQRKKFFRSLSRELGIRIVT